ncbi:MAG: DoxX family membrane protein [Hellea sp.]|nr:DoxX family membrane protein [Hellea sp.]
MNQFKRFLPSILAIYSSVIFLDSLRYKFTNHENTQTIFGKLNDWAASLGAEGLFAQTGLFSQYVIGSAELLASAALLLGLLPRFRRLQGFGALLGAAVMTGAIYFHTMTPLGTDPNEDGGLLFIMAMGVWISCAALVVIRRREIGYGIGRIIEALLGQPVA